MAGSSKNSQPCRFIVIDDQAVKEEVAKCGDFAAGSQVRRCSSLLPWPDEAPRSEYDAGRASQNMMVAAWAEEIGSCPVSMHHVECAREALGLPDDWRVSVVVAFGYRERPPKSVPEAARAPWEEYVRHNRWE